MKVKLVGIDENMHAELCKLFHKCKAIASLILDKPVLSEKEQNVANDISNFLCSVLICDVYSRKAPDYTNIALYEQLKMLKKNVKKILQRAPEEDICANEENEIFADLENLYADLEDLLKN